MTQSVENAIAAFEPPLPLAVALSGGADSVALLVACVRKWGGAETGAVRAIHVNHNLQSAATQFEAHCRALCKHLNVPLTVQSVDANPASGQSPEDAARQARYKAFSAVTLIPSAHPAIKKIASIAIAQHADDQIETLLLALSRGAGLAGLSAMPAQWERDGIVYHRPFLQVAGAEIRRWLHQQYPQHLPFSPLFIEDPTNTDIRFTRNRIRAQLMPVLRDVFPQCLDTFTRSSRHAAEAEGLLQELAQDDWQRVGNAVGCNIAALQNLSRARQANVLRFWLKNQHATIPSTVQLQELQRQLAACTTRGHRIHLKVGAGFVQRQGKVLVYGLHRAAL